MNAPEAGQGVGLREPTLREPKPMRSTNRSTLDQHSRAVALILHEEFDTPFVFQDAKTGAVLPGPEAGESTVPLDAAEVLELARNGQAQVVALPAGGYRVSIPLYSAGHPLLVGVGVLASLTSYAAERGKEARRLAKWAQSVCERLRGSDYILSRERGAEEEKAQGKGAWEAILRIDHLLRHLRAHKCPDGSQKRILHSVFDLLGIESLAWVPHEPTAAVVVLGTSLLTPADYRQLALLLSRTTELKPASPLLCNDFTSRSASSRFSTVTNLMAFVVADQKPLGWVLALNKKPTKGRVADENDCVPFRHSDAALLTPFVAMLGLQGRTTTRYQDLKDLLVGLTRALTAALDAKDAYTFGHSERVARISVELGRELGLNEDELGNIYLAGLLHDIGKIGVRDAVLTKAGALTPEEHDEIKQHVTIGYAILADLHQIRDLLPGVLYHHEKYDGTGYPDGLIGEAIPLQARILAVADAYDAMSTTRPYRDAMPGSRVEQILLQGAGKQWDKRVIDTFFRCREAIYAIRQRGVGGSLRKALDGALRKHDNVSVMASVVADDSV